MKAHDNNTLYTMVTPEMAADFLNHNTFNRPLRAGRVEQLVRIIKDGNWKKNGSTALIGENGAIFDAQHRFFAIVEADIAVPMIIIKNVPMDALPTIDTGLPRNYSDYRRLSANGTGTTYSYPNELSAALRLIHWYETRWPGFVSGGTKGLVATHQELDEVAARHPSLPDCVAAAAGSGPLKRLGSLASTAFVYTMAHENFPEQADQWLHVLKTGDAQVEHPANLLRERLIARQISGKHLDTTTRIVYLTKSWNAFAQGKSKSSLRWLPDEPVPAIFGTVQYTGPRAGHSARAERIKKVRQESGKVSRLGRSRRKGAKQL